MRPWADRDKASQEHEAEEFLRPVLVDLTELGGGGTFDSLFPSVSCLGAAGTFSKASDPPALHSWANLLSQPLPFSSLPAFLFAQWHSMLLSFCFHPCQSLGLSVT